MISFFFCQEGSYHQHKSKSVIYLAMPRKSQTEERIYKYKKINLHLYKLYQGIQAGEDWAIQASKDLQVADSPDKNDNNTNAQLLRSNNELASLIKSMVA